MDRQSASQLSLFEGTDAPPLSQPTRPSSWPAMIAAYIAFRKEQMIRAWNKENPDREYTPPHHSLGAFRRDLNILSEIAPVDDPAALSTEQALQAVDVLNARSTEVTARRRHGTWRAFYGWMEKKEWIQNSPFRFQMAAQTPRPKLELQYLTPREAQVLLQAADREESPAPAFLIRLALYTGMKVSEMALLKVKDLIPEQDRVRVHGKHPRDVAVPHDLFEAYEQFLVYLRKQGRAPENPDSLAIGYTKRWMEKELRSVTEKVKNQLGQRPTYGTLRWTRAVWDLRNGVSEDRVRTKLGFTEIAWVQNTRKRLKPFIADPREGQMPTD